MDWDDQKARVETSAKFLELMPEAERERLLAIDRAIYGISFVKASADGQRVERVDPKDVGLP